MLTQEYLTSLLRYDPETGLFTRLQSRNLRYRIGEIAGTLASSGHRKISIDGKPYLAHRLAFLYMAGKWPDGEVDHHNGLPDDNRWENLRDVPPIINRQNLRICKAGNQTMMLGVHKRSTGGFRARIYANGKLHYLGTFDTAVEAHEAYVAAKRRFHPGCTI